MNSDYLKHYGVLGMKWGVHKKQYSNTVAKSYRELDKRTATANKRTTAANNARKELNKVNVTAQKLGVTAARNAQRLDAERKTNNTIKSIDLSQYRKKSLRPSVNRYNAEMLKAHTNAMRSSDEKVKKWQNAVDKTLIAKERIKDTQRKASSRAKTSKKAADRANKRRERFERSMMSTFSEIDDKYVEEGRKLYEMKYKRS